jgi:DNA (cytosine-5)-methyltransferase 1
MTKYNLLDLFAGIGGISLGLERSEAFSTVAFCEIDEFCHRVLKKHWPEVPIYNDVRTITAKKLASDGITVDAICGGFPCQDVSEAGKKAGLAGGRSGLWFEYARLIGELRPKYVIVENVSELLIRGFDEVLGTLATLGYDAEWHCIQACDVGAPHIRDRVFIIAYPSGVRFAGKESEKQGEGATGLFTRSRFFKRKIKPECEKWWPSEPYIPRVVNGVPNRSHRCRTLGNAVVPQISEIIGLAIKEFENNFSNPLDT